MHSDSVRAALLLSNRLVRLDVAPLKAREFWTVLDRADASGLEIGALLDDPSRCDAVADDEALTGERLRALLDATRAFAFEVERLQEAGIEVVSALDERFPPLLRDRMEHGCPPHVFAAGDLAATRLPTLSIVGEPTAGDVLHGTARRAVAAGVVAGWSIATADSTTAGDLASTIVAEALACEASLLVISGNGINRAAREPDLRRSVQAAEICLLSPFSPDAPTSTATIRARDAMLHALRARTLVVSCEDGTGTIWGAAFEAVRREPGSVVVVTDDDAPSGSRALAELGARRLDDIDDLSELLA